MHTVAAFSSHRPEIWAIFILTYLGIAVGRVPGLKLDRTGIALLGAIATLVFGGLSTDEVMGFVNWPTLLLLFGFFVLSAQLQLSGFFDAVAGGLARRIGDPGRFLLLFAGLFVVTGAFEASGCTADVARHLQHAGLNLAEPGKLAVAAAALSNLISNAAAVMLLVKMVPFSHATVAYILALASSFGGSLLIVGSVANIIVVQRAAEMGISISFGRFARIGLPVTIAALAGLVAWSALMPAG